MISPFFQSGRPKLLLIQARSGPEMERQERTCFEKRCAISPDQFRYLNVARGDQPSAHTLENVDAVLIGGAGKYSAADDYEWTAPLFDLVRRAVRDGLPMFGSCWGHQVIARALGGEVLHDPTRAELGCRWVQRTAAGAEDPLFSRFPARFRANMGHHDRVVSLPSEGVELAANEQPYQAFRLRDTPVYGTQFHSELDAQGEKERILAYRKYYRQSLPDEQTVQSVIDDLEETTEVDSLLYDFLATYVAGPTSSGSIEEILPLQASSHSGTYAFGHLQPE